MADVQLDVVNEDEERSQTDGSSVEEDAFSEVIRRRPRRWLPADDFVDIKNMRIFSIAFNNSIPSIRKKVIVTMSDNTDPRDDNPETRCPTMRISMPIGTIKPTETGKDLCDALTLICDLVVKNLKWTIDQKNPFIVKILNARWVPNAFYQEFIVLEALVEMPFYKGRGVMKGRLWKTSLKVISMPILDRSENEARHAINNIYNFIRRVKRQWEYDYPPLVGVNNRVNK